jgi:hypothetical protein
MPGWHVISTAVELMSAATESPRQSRISRTASAEMIDAIAQSKSQPAQEVRRGYIRNAADKLAPGANHPSLGDGSPFDPVEQECIQFRFGDSIMAAGSFDRRDFSLVDPLLQRPITQTERRGRIQRAHQVQPTGQTIRS